MPNYDSLYMVYSEVMAEAALRTPGTNFEGIVGELVPDNSDGSASTKGAYFTAVPKVTAPAPSEATEAEATESVVLETLPSRSATSQIHAESTTTGPDEFGPQRTQSGDAIKRENSGSKAQNFRIPLHPASSLTSEHAARDVIVIPYHPRICHTAQRERMASRRFIAFAIAISAPFGVSLLSLAIIGAISRFEAGASSGEQRGIVIAWLAWSVAYPVIEILMSIWDKAASLLFAIIVLGTAVPLALFVNVGMEMTQYGNCVLIPL